MQALILAGGEGTRLRPLTSTIPKPVVPLVGRPFISYMLQWLRRHGVDDVILGCGFMADAVRDVLGDGSGLGIRLRYLEEPRPLGTGGAGRGPPSRCIRSRTPRRTAWSAASRTARSASSSRSPGSKSSTPT